MNLKKLRANILLCLTALIWGSSFVAQSVGMDFVGPFTFNTVRSLLGGLVLIPVAMFTMRKKTLPSGVSVWRNKALWLGGFLCGVATFIASNLQLIGMQYTSVGKAGFITALYIVIVPIIGLFFKKEAPASIWLAVAMALVGLYLLCVKEGFSIGKGDLLVLLSAVGFSAHIMIIDHFSPKVDGVAMSCIQFLTAALLCAFPMFTVEEPQISSILSAWLPIGYAGVLSCAIACTLQIIAQKDTSPTAASLLMSLESVFAALSGWAFLGESFSSKELIGCLLVFAAVLLAQFPASLPFKKKQEKNLSS